MIIIEWINVRNYNGFFTYNKVSITYAMFSTSLVTCIMKIISVFLVFCIISVFFFNFFPDIWHIFCLSYDICCLFVHNTILLFTELIISIACSFEDLKHFFMQPLLLHTSYLISIPSKANVIDIKWLAGIFLPNFVVDKLIGLFFLPFIFLIKDSISTWIIIGEWW